jgi:hypothetical protein
MEMNRKGYKRAQKGDLNFRQAEETGPLNAHFHFFLPPNRIYQLTTIPLFFAPEVDRLGMLLLSQIRVAAINLHKMHLISA